MSREYYFYPAEQKDGKYYPALLERDNDKLDPATCYWTGADYIPDEVKEELEKNLIDPKDMQGEFIPYMCLDENLEGRYMYELSSKFVEEHSGSGMVVGYMPVETVLEAQKYEEPLSEFKYEYIKPEIYAELPNKDKYMRVSYMDYTSLEYICRVLHNAIWNLRWFEKDLCIIMVYSY